ncbi:MAG: U32 family peptidase [Slackia piriformis]|uniref:U32 family peptidase n=1 Tax=Slackia piriformis TaxID=626934 RepID=A0A943V002_9ACTN|nr:U32 family peptidase [Slackia piriformis]
MSMPSSRKTMELLAPAGGWEQLEYAVHFGADAVYLASQRYGMRRRADNFSEDDLPRVVEYAHAHGVDVHVTVNTMMTDADTDDLPRYFGVLEAAGVDAVIVGDMGALAIARSAAPHVAIHLSTQASCMNAEAAKLYASIGVSRIVLAREMSLEAIAEMRWRLPEEIELEAFVHGAMCMAYSGRCLISDHLAGRGANVGHCAQPCRWKYALVEETRPGQYFPVEQDDRGSFIMSSNDMNMLSHLQELADAGVNSVKIEGRAKGAYYVASTVNAYRHVLDGASADAWQAELETTSHRPYSTGFYFGGPGQNQGTVEYARSHQMVARVLGCAAEGDALFRVEVLCRNRFFEGEELEVISPDADVRTVRVENLRWHAAPETDLSDIERDGIGRLVGPDPSCEGGTLVAVGVANRTMERYSFTVLFELHERDILRIRRDGQDVGRVL